MKTIKDKYIVVGSDGAGYPLKEAVCAHLRAKGWKITDLGVTDPDVEDTENMVHRVGLRVAAQVSEGNFERALVPGDDGVYFLAAPVFFNPASLEEVSQEAFDSLLAAL